MRGCLRNTAILGILLALTLMLVVALSFLFGDEVRKAWEEGCIGIGIHVETYYKCPNEQGTYIPMTLTPVR